MATTQKISTCLWFDDNAEEAASFYVSLFDDSRILEVHRYGDWGQGMPKGSVAFLAFDLCGVTFQALNGGPHFKFTEASSMFVKCDDQSEIDRLWDALLEGGAAQQCGWLKDRFGLPWQIVPAALPEMIRRGNPEKTNRLMQAVMTMVKLDIAQLEQAYNAS